RYCLRLDLLDDEQSIDSLDEAIEAVPRDEWNRKYPAPGEQLRAGRIPVTALREAADFFVWRDDALNEYHGYTGPDLTALYRKLLSGLHNYEIPAVVIDPSIPPAGIARIFERVNRLGMRLGTFDLMVAKSFH